MIQQERRSCRRKALEQLAYVSLPSDNGGIVLDVSEGGLGFHAVAPIESSQPIHFRFSVKSLAGIEAVGEVAWIDETGKSGGLRFTHLPDGVREQVRIWLGQPSVSLPVVPVSVPPTEIESAPACAANSAPTEAIQPLPAEKKPAPIRASVSPLSMFPPEMPRVAEPAAIASRRPFSSRHTIAALILTIVLASIVAIGFFSYVYMRKTDERLIHWGEKVWGIFYPQQAVPTPGSPANSQSDTAQ